MYASRYPDASRFGLWVVLGHRARRASHTPRTFALTAACAHDHLTWPGALDQLQPGKPTRAHSGLGDPPIGERKLYSIPWLLKHYSFAD